MNQERLVSFCTETVMETTQISLPNKKWLDNSKKDSSDLKTTSHKAIQLLENIGDTPLKIWAASAQRLCFYRWVKSSHFDYSNQSTAPRQYEHLPQPHQSVVLSATKPARSTSPRRASWRSSSAGHREELAVLQTHPFIERLTWSASSRRRPRYGREDGVDSLPARRHRAVLAAERCQYAYTTSIRFHDHQPLTSLANK